MRPITSFVFLGLILAGSVARADWPSSPTVNVPVVAAPGTQGCEGVVTDGRGGMIVIWQDQTDWHLFAQRIDASGNARWAPSGVPVCTAAGTQSDTRVVPDGAGGVLVMWADGRNGGNDLYAQRVSGNGSRLWADTGVPLCAGTGASASGIAVASDGKGGLLVLWQDGRGGASPPNLFVQSLDSLGAVRWAVNGARVTANGVGMQTAAVAPDDSSGAIVTWHDWSVNTFHPFAQRIDAAGQLRWNAAGVQVGSGPRTQLTPRLTGDGAGGAYVVWAEDRSYLGTDNTTTAQHVDASGALLWGAGGLPVGPASGDQQYQSALRDGAGGMIVVWTDLKTKSGWAQRVASNGTRLWPANGAPFAPAHLGNSLLPVLYPQPDGFGCVFAAWTDYRTGDGDVYAQHLDPSGTATWAADGVPVCTAPGLDSPPFLAPDGAGGILVAWSDPRSDVDWDVYAQNVAAAGTLGGTTVSVPLPRGGDGLAVRALGAEPHRDGLAVECALAGASPAVVRLLDVSGRCVQQGVLAGSAQRVTWRPESVRLVPGVYLVQVTQAGHSVTTRFVWLR